MTTQIAQTASKGAPENFPVAQIPYGPYVGGAMGMVLSVVGAILYVRRRLSRDNTAIAHEQSERNMLNKMSAERDRAMSAAEEAWRTRAEDAKLIGQLTGEVKHLTEANQNLIQDVESLRKDIKELREVLSFMLPTVPGMNITTEELREFLTQRAALNNGG